MIKGILFTLLVVFACLGFCDLFYILRSVLLAPGIKNKKYCVVFLKSGEAVNQLRFLSDKLRWYGNEFCDELIGIVDDLDDTQISECESFCYGGNIYLCRFENIIGQLSYLETGDFDEGQYIENG